MPETKTLNLVNTTFDFLADSANYFYQAKQSEGKSAYTLTFYRQQLGHFLKYCEAQNILKMGDITAATVREFLLWHEQTGHNPGGQHAAYRTLKAFLRWYDLEAEPENWKNPIRKVKGPRMTLDPLPPVEISDIDKLVKTCEGKSLLDKRDKALFLFLLDTGARAREAVAVNLADVDQVSGEVIIKHGKGDKSRAVFIGKSSRQALRAYLKLRTVGGPALWLSDDNERLSYSGLNGILKRRAEKAGINPPPTLHAFRRAFAINMLRAGTDLITLARLMGHTSLTVLQRYLKQITTDLQAAHVKGGPVDRLL